MARPFYQHTVHGKPTGTQPGRPPEEKPCHRACIKEAGPASPAGPTGGLFHNSPHRLSLSPGSQCPGPDGSAPMRLLAPRAPVVRAILLSLTGEGGWVPKRKCVGAGGFLVGHRSAPFGSSTAHGSCRYRRSLPSCAAAMTRPSVLSTDSRNRRISSARAACSRHKASNLSARASTGPAHNASSLRSRSSGDTHQPPWFRVHNDAWRTIGH